MKRILLVFSALIVAVVAMCLMYMPGSLYVPMHSGDSTLPEATAPPATATAPPAEEAQADTPAPTPEPTPEPTPAPTPEPATAPPEDTGASDQPADTPEITPDTTPELTPDTTPESGGDTIDIEGAATTAPAQNAAAAPPPPKMTPIPATPRTAPPDAPLAYEPSVDESQKSNGVIQVRYYSDSKPKMKVQIKQSSTYNYDMRADNSPFRYPLNMGSGSYEVSMLVNRGGTSYSIVDRRDIDVSLSSDTAPYLQSIQLIDWDPAMAPILEAFAFQASQGNVTDAIYTRLANYLSYDFSKLGKLKSGYIPDITDTYETGKGICYDMSALFASMLRSVGVPTRLMMGNSKLVSGYHAWNEVYVNGEWVIVDLTVDTQLRDYGDPFTFAKKKSDYSASKRY